MTAESTPSPEPSLKPRWLDELRPEKPFATLSAGIISGAITTIFTISLVGLIFTGPLRPHVPLGVGWFLVGAVVMGLWVALTSSFAGNIATPQGKPAVILTLASGALAASVQADQQLSTVFMLMVSTALLTGLSLYLLGQFQLGNLTRFIPYPVIGGFQVGTGWLILVGAFSVLTGHRLSLESLPTLVGSDLLWRWLPAMIYALFMIVVLRYKPHFMSLLLLILSGIALFYLGVWFSGASLEQLRADKWLLGPFPRGSLWQAPDLAKVDWTALSKQAPTMMVAVLLVATDVLLVSVAIEITTSQRLDLDQELKSTGLGNIVTGLVGGMTGFSALSLVLLNDKVGASNRLTAVVSALVCGLFLLWGIPLLDYFPVIVLGSLLLFFGFAFMKDWVWDGWSRLSLVDTLMIYAIWILVAFIGFLPGVGAGLLMAMVIFIVNYSRTKVIKLELSGAELRSNRERSSEESQLLDQHGAATRVFKLQGYVFFGTANNLLERTRALFEAPEPPPRTIILDFRAITGIDSSATASFRQMVQQSKSQGTKLLFASVPDAVTQILDGEDLRRETQEAVGDRPQLDHCLEWCENQILASEQLTGTPRSYDTTLAEIFSEDAGQAFKDALERREFARGELLFGEGDPAESLLFIESGQIAASVTNALGEAERIRSFGAGAIVGEMGLYTQDPRSASLTATEPAVVHLLTRVALDKIEREQPQVALAFHRAIARILAGRLGQANNTLKFLLR